jgi:hypothetical protein
MESCQSTIFDTKIIISYYNNVINTILTSKNLKNGEIANNQHSWFRDSRYSNTYVSPETIIDNSVLVMEIFLENSDNDNTLLLERWKLIINTKQRSSTTTKKIDQSTLSYFIMSTSETVIKIMKLCKLLPSIKLHPCKKTKCDGVKYSIEINYNISNVSCLTFEPNVNTRKILFSKIPTPVGTVVTCLEYITGIPDIDSILLKKIVIDNLLINENSYTSDTVARIEPVYHKDTDTVKGNGSKPIDIFSKIKKSLGLKFGVSLPKTSSVKAVRSVSAPNQNIVSSYDDMDSVIVFNSAPVSKLYCDPKVVHSSSVPQFNAFLLRGNNSDDYDNSEDSEDSESTINTLFESADSDNGTTSGYIATINKLVNEINDEINRNNDITINKIFVLSCEKNNNDNDIHIVYDNITIVTLSNDNVTYVTELTEVTEVTDLKISNDYEKIKEIIYFIIKEYNLNN